MVSQRHSGTHRGIERHSGTHITQRFGMCRITDGGSMSGHPASGMCRNICIVLQVGSMVGCSVHSRHYVSAPSANTDAPSGMVDQRISSIMFLLGMNLGDVEGGSY